MLPFENMITYYVKKTKHHVLYRGTPIFVGNELVARGVFMEGYSVEDRGKGIEFCIFTYNVQPGITIDYSTGLNHLETEMKKNTAATTATSAKNAQTYVLNTSTKKIHMSGCSRIKTMSEENKYTVTKTIGELEALGYSRCKNLFQVKFEVANP